MKGEMFEVRVTDDHNAGLEHIADLNSLLALRLSELNGVNLARCRLHLKLFHVVNIKVW